ncbi:hypothetical protein HZB02_06785 [Candidatus Woesearchaeota archaeon]|nr:hypothetical protein [Candidatus Woesearchaeota archaeon]
MDKETISTPLFVAIEQQDALHQRIVHLQQLFVDCNMLLDKVEEIQDLETRFVDEWEAILASTENQLESLTHAFPGHERI